jgi:hypothetical protein
LIVQDAICHLLGAQSFTKIIGNNLVCGEIFMLYIIGQQASTLSRFSVDINEDAAIFTLVRYEWFNL